MWCFSLFVGPGSPLSLKCCEIDWYINADLAAQASAIEMSKPSYGPRDRDMRKGERGRDLKPIISIFLLPGLN